MATIVVGVDGSEGGKAALEFAAEEAGLRGADLRVIMAWEIPPSVVAGVAYDSGFFQESKRESRQHAEAIVNEAVARATELHPTLKCRGRAIEGQQAKVILEESQNAVLIVVGTRGRGGFTGLLIGSISQQVVGHAHCPVVVVPPLAAQHSPDR